MATPLPPPELSPLVIEGSRLKPLAGEAVFSARQLDLSDLQSAPRLDAALKSVPGVSLFRRTGSDGANPTIQGISLRSIGPSGAGRALVTLDGTPVNDPFGGWVIWSALPPEGLGGVNIVRGVGAGAYGGGALTGVVALQTRRPGPSQIFIRGEFGALQEKRIMAEAGGPHLSLVGGIESTDGYQPVRGAAAGAADKTSKLNSSTLSGHVQGDWSGIHSALRLGGYQERRGAGLLGANSVASGGDFALTLTRPSETGGWRIQAWARESYLSNTSVAVSAGRTSVTPASDQYSTPALGYGINAALQGRGPVWSWEAGADARFASGRAFERFRYQNGAFTRGRESGGRTSISGIYLDITKESGPLLLTGGLRIDAWSQEEAVRRERDLSTGALTLDSPSKDSSGRTPTGRLGAKLSLTEDTSIRAAAYSGFRPPTLNELHRPFRVGNDVTEANPYLTPEKLHGLEVGLSGSRLATWSISLFYNEIKDPVTNVTIGVGPRTFPVAGFIPAGGALRMRQNAGQISATGAEVEFRKSFGPFKVSAEGAYTRARVDGGQAAPQLTGKRPAQAPEVTIAAGLDWDVRPNLSLSANARYESDRFEDDLNTRILPAATGFDARVEWRVQDSTSVFLALENIADSNIVVGQTGDGVSSFASPRTVRVGFVLR